KKTQCAVMLTGPPGTRKTTLVEVIAELLRWPLVTVPASAIFEAGFDSMEARASEVFRRLNYLSGCVIFFDEFEEFFRDRGPGDSSIHDRTIAAFTTSAMLPRLQELHDQRRCLIFLATNDENKIDPAIKRPGRYDFRLDINHRTCSRIIEYLDAPTCRTLEDIGIKVDKAKCGVDTKDKKNVANFEKSKDAVKMAVNKLFELDDEVRFSDVEEALRQVAALRPMGTKRKRVGKAKESLKKSRRNVDASEAGPPKLCDLP
ncbi:MAG: AAA family ATPase, partial [Deltaproteobacteria bacterium]|nr:AAA family ATPase [Deltaproteobacteria bacterium]